MQIFIHRVNTIEKLQTIPTEYGVEIDVRGYGDTLLLNHDPIKNPADNDELEEYLKHYKHSGVIFNLKEAGYEARVIALAEKYGIKKLFFIGCRIPLSVPGLTA